MPIQLAAAGGVNLGAAGGAVVADGSPCCCGGACGDPSKFAHTYVVTGTLYTDDLFAAPGSPAALPHPVDAAVYLVGSPQVGSGAYAAQWTGGSGGPMTFALPYVVLDGGLNASGETGHCFRLAVYAHGDGAFDQGDVVWGFYKDGTDPAGTYYSTEPRGGLGDTVQVS